MFTEQEIEIIGNIYAAWKQRWRPIISNYFLPTSQRTQDAANELISEINKLPNPDIVKELTQKVKAWESEMNATISYVKMLEEMYD